MTGAGKAFSAGGDLEMVEANGRRPQRLLARMREAADIVYNMINLDKPIDLRHQRGRGGRRAWRWR